MFGKTFKRRKNVKFGKNQKKFIDQFKFLFTVVMIDMFVKNFKFKYFYKYMTIKSIFHKQI